MEGKKEAEKAEHETLGVEPMNSNSSTTTAVPNDSGHSPQLSTNLRGNGIAEGVAGKDGGVGNGNGNENVANGEGGEGREGREGMRMRRRGRDTRPKNLHVDPITQPKISSPSNSTSSKDLKNHDGLSKSNNVDAEKGLPDADSDSGDRKKETEDKKEEKSWTSHIPSSLQWTIDNWTWTKLKPAIRCAVVAWVSALLFIIPDVQKVMGQAAFLILIAAVLSPPSDPFIAVLEREFLILLFVSTSWAWSCLGMYLSSLSRSPSPSSLPSSLTNPTTAFPLAVTGQFIQLGSSAIMLLFLFLGTMFWLYIRAVQGPGPYLFACVFAIIGLDICCTTAALFPFPYYGLGKTVIIPLALHSGISLLGSILIFPSSTSALFTTRLSALLEPTIHALELHLSLLSTPPSSPTFPLLASQISSAISKSEAQILPLAAATRLLGKDLVWGRYSPKDWKPFQDMARRMCNRGNGLGLYLSLVDPTRQRFPVTPAPSSPANTGPSTPVWIGSPGSSRAPSRVVSRVGSPERDGGGGTPVVGTTTPILETGNSTPTPSHTPRGEHHARFMDAVTRTDSVQSISASASRRKEYFREHGFHHPLTQPHSHSHTHGKKEKEKRDKEKRGRSREGSTKGSLKSHREHRDSAAHHARHEHHYWRHHHHHMLHHALHNLSFSLSEDRLENVVGVFESQKYMNLEAELLSDPDAERWTGRLTGLLGESATPLLLTLTRSLTTIHTFLTTARHDRIKYLINPRKVKQGWEKEREGHEREREELSRVGEEFRWDLRFRVLEPYRPAFERRMSRHQNRRENEEKQKAEGKDEGNWEGWEDDSEEEETPAHRYLFHCFMYQYHLIQLAEIVGEMMDEMIKLETKRQRNQLWTPIQKLIRWRHWEVSDQFTGEVDEDPDAIQGLDPSISSDLGLPMRRDPDALPPRNLFESVMSWVYHAVTGLAGGNVLYAVKAGVLAVLLALPSVVEGSAGFAYENRFVWGVIMGSITLARFRGDTIFGFFARVASTFLGGAVGMAMWYISTGSGHGNPYGLAVVFGICCPFIFYARLYYPGPPMTQIVFFVTICLVVGYSYLDVTQSVPGSPGFGFTVWWRRCLLVTTGVFAAFIFSFLPPSTTIRRYSRATLATTCSELGAIYCAILSYANERSEEQVTEINTSLLAVRSKLKRSIALRTNVIYEFSLRGRWPVERYNALCDMQIQIAYSLAHFMSVVKHLEPAWARALLRRTRFMDTDFQGEILAVLTMISSALRTGHPLPQITPCPLLDRFLAQSSGLDIMKKETEEDYGLPRTLTLETLMNEQYLFFCVGVSTAFNIMARLDRLMVAAKEIVGEHYHIHGIGLAPTVTRQLNMDASGPAEEQYRPPRDEEV